MARGYQKKEEIKPAAPKKSKASFTELMAQVPSHVFVSMMGRAGLPVHEARRACQLHKELK